VINPLAYRAVTKHQPAAGGRQAAAAQSAESAEIFVKLHKTSANPKFYSRGFLLVFVKKAHFMPIFLRFRKPGVSPERRFFVQNDENFR
jgi:hypothetical protein